MSSSRITFRGLLLLGLAVPLLASGCIRAPRPAVPPAEGVRPAAEEFMRRVAANEWEAGFRLVDIDTLVNYGNEQGPVYRSLSPSDQERYRRYFIEGLNTYFFRTLPPDGMRFTISVPDPAAPVVEVVGRPKKKLRFTLRVADGAWKITRIDRLE